MSCFSPTSLNEALEILSSGDDITICAGATDIAPRLHTGGELVRLMDITHVAELGGISHADGVVAIGATATFDEIAHSELIQKHAPLLAAAAGRIGSQQVRNRATLAGNIANAAPAADSVPALAVLDATVTLLRSGGRRDLPICDFITGANRTAMGSGELVARVSFPVPPEGCGQAYIKVGRRNALAISRISAAAIIEKREGKVTAARLSIGASSTRPLRLTRAEALLNGQTVDEALAAECGSVAADELLAVTGNRPSFAYKLPVAADMIRDCILRAWEDCHER